MSSDARAFLTCQSAFDAPEMLETHLVVRSRAAPISEGSATEWLHARKIFAPRNETLWIIAPGAGVLLLLAATILLLGS